MPDTALDDLHAALEPFRRVVDINAPLKPAPQQSLRILLSITPTWMDLLQLVAAGEKVLLEGGHSNAG